MHAYIYIYIYTLKTKKLFLFLCVGESVWVVIYNKLLLNHLWSSVLKLMSELHDFI